MSYVSGDKHAENVIFMPRMLKVKSVQTALVISWPILPQPP